MTATPPGPDPLKQLVMEWLDGEPTPQQVAEMQRLLSTSPDCLEQVVDHLLLDSLLQQELGAEAVASLVDLVAEPATNAHPAGLSAPAPRRDTLMSPHSNPAIPSPWRRGVVWLSAAAILLTAAFLLGRQASTAVASPATLIQEAARTHSVAIERVYQVEAARSTRSPETETPRDVRVTTLGDQFFVEMNRGQRRLVWGRSLNNGVWICLGPSQAILIEPGEVGAPLEYLANLYSLQLESLLDTFVRKCQLSRADETDTTHVINVLPRRAWRGGWLRSAQIEIDRETKVIRRLTIDRDTPTHGPSTLTFTLLDSRPAEESRYQPAGHLTPPFQLQTRDSQPDTRRELLRTWFSPLSERWIKTPANSGK